MSAALLAPYLFTAARAYATPTSSRRRGSASARTGSSPPAPRRLSRRALRRAARWSPPGSPAPGTNAASARALLRIQSWRMSRSASIAFFARFDAGERIARCPRAWEFPGDARAERLEVLLGGWTPVTSARRREENRRASVPTALSAGPGTSAPSTGRCCDSVDEHDAADVRSHRG